MRVEYRNICSACGNIICKHKDFPKCGCWQFHICVYKEKKEKEAQPKGELKNEEM
jgi:hypothetical protein